MSKEAKTKVSANPMAVEWPRDAYQLTQKFKAEGLRTAARVGTQKDKLEVFVATLDVLKEHAIEAYKKRKGIEKETQEAAIKRAKEEARINKARQDARVKQLEAELASVKGETEAAAEAE